MTNEQYLKGIKKAEENRIADYGINFEQLVGDEENDKVREVKALEIIAETLISINKNMVSTGYVTAKL